MCSYFCLLLPCLVSLYTGRSHRSNQVHGPEYHLVLSSAGGEKRFASAIARKLESLGALTQGDRRATHSQMGMGLQSFNLETTYGEAALKELMDVLRGQMHPAEVRLCVLVRVLHRLSSS